MSVDICQFPIEAKYARLRTSADVAARPWRTPLPRAAGPGPSCAREYGKDQARHHGGFARPSTERMNYSKMPLQIARAGFGISGAPRLSTASHRSSRTASRTRASTLGAVPIAYFSATAERSASLQENCYRLDREVAHGHLLLLELES